MQVIYGMRWRGFHRMCVYRKMDNLFGNCINSIFGAPRYSLA